MASPFPTNMKLSFCQKSKDYLLPKNTLKMPFLASIKKMMLILEKMILAFLINILERAPAFLWIPSEQEHVRSLSFLDVKMCRKNGKFVISVYRKPTFSGVFTNYESFIPMYQKRGLLHTLLHRSFSICCDFKTFHFEIDHLKTILIKNNYPLNFIDSCIKSFLNKLYTPKVVVPNVPKRNVFVKLPFLGSTSFQIRKKLQKLFIVFTSPVESKAFSPSKISYLRCYFQDLFESINVVAAMALITERPNAILKPEFVSI